jgi:superfamily II RNA helicase
MLEILLLSPPAQDWVSSIKYAIIDEVHNISNRNEGDIWERVLVLLPCPVICLSATIGNFDKFANWFEGVCTKKNQQVCKIKYNNRHNDIQMWVSYCLPILDPMSNKWQLGYEFF